MSAMKVITVVWFSFFILFGYIIICEADPYKYTKEEMEEHRKQGGDSPKPVELSFFERAITHRFNRFWYTWFSRKKWDDSNVKERINEINNRKIYDLSNSVYTDLDSMILGMNYLNEDTQKQITRVLHETLNHLTEKYNVEKNKDMRNYLHNKIETCEMLMKNAMYYSTAHELKHQLSKSKTFGGSHYMSAPPEPDTEEKK